MRRIEYLVFIVGAGGTGGNFAKEFGRYLSFFREKGKSVKTILIDGDRVEQKNTERQPFLSEDVQQFKAVALGSLIQETFELYEFYNYPHYIDSVDDLMDLFEQFASYKPEDKSQKEECVTLPVVIGAVDNHRARQCMHQFFKKVPNCFYFDSANEFSVGEVVLAGKLNNVELSPDRAFYYPDILTDDSPAASELSCGSVNESTPQHLATNLMAAGLLLSSVVSLMSENSFNGGIIYFDRSQFFSRFQPYGEICKEAAANE